MINYCTHIDIPKSVFNITYRDDVMFLGSCFAGNIGAKMTEYRFNVSVNPFGALYNPFSLAAGFRRLLEPTPFNAEDLFHHNGLYHSFMHHGDFSDVSEAGCVSKINESLSSAAKRLRNASYLVVTFGTSYVYCLKNSGQVVANCHKLPAAHFDHELLTVDMIVEEWSDLLKKIRQANPLLKVIFTVSPIRHWKDGAHFNQISKATLLLAEHALVEQNPDYISYFPAYELMLDELRDYRFYAEDMLHPSTVAVDYIWERFYNTYMNAETKKILNEVGIINKALNHRPLNPSVDTYKVFLMQTLLKIQSLQSKCPYICLSIEEDKLKSKLRNI